MQRCVKLTHRWFSAMRRWLKRTQPCIKHYQAGTTGNRPPPSRWRRARPGGPASHHRVWGKHPMASAGFFRFSVWVMSNNRRLPTVAHARSAPPEPVNPVRPMLVVADERFFCQPQAEWRLRLGYEVEVTVIATAGWAAWPASRCQCLIAKNAAGEKPLPPNGQGYPPADGGRP